MRVITGTCRGLRLKTLDGLTTRPTADRVKEGMFSAIQFEIEGRKALDLFAGSGQLGIEALSRGAAHAVFIDASAEAVRVVKENLQHTRLTQISTLLQCDSLVYLDRCREKFDLVFLDPPYESGLLNASLKKISEIDILSESGIIICEYAMTLPPTIPERLRVEREYRYGRIGVALLRRKEKRTE